MRYVILNSVPPYRAGQIIDTDAGQDPRGAIEAGAQVLPIDPSLETALAKALNALAKGYGDGVATGIMLGAKAASANGRSFLWAPDGDASTWDQVMQRIDAAGGQCEVLLRPGLTYSIPASAERYPFRHSVFRTPVAINIEVHIEDGATLLDCDGIIGSGQLFAYATDDTKPAFAFSAFDDPGGSPGIFLGQFGGGIKQQGTAPAIIIPDNKFFVFAGAQGSPFLSGGLPNQEMIRLGDNSILLLTTISSPANTPDGAITGPVTSAIAIQHDGSGRVPALLPDFFGNTFNVPFGNDAGAGPTTFRPFGVFGPVLDGARYYDTTLFTALWWDATGMQWRDATGTVVP